MNIKRDKWGRFSRRGHTLAWVALAVVMIATGLVLTHDLNEIEYTAIETVVKTDEQKLTEHLNNKMVEQKEARVLELRAFEALEEATALRELADEEMQKALDNITIYQGI